MRKITAMAKEWTSLPSLTADLTETGIPSFPLSGKTALVTGGSRGIGASVARQLAEFGADIAINYRSKAPRAQNVAHAIMALGRNALLLQGDITNQTDVTSMFEQLQSEWGRLDILVLNASGGLEKGKSAGYAMALNLTAQVNLVMAAFPLMQPGSCIVFVTSHLAHFYGVKPVHDGYGPVAASKKAGEDALRKMIPELSRRGIRLLVVSGELIEGTITPKLLQRQCPGLIEERRRASGSLPDVEEFAAAIARCAIPNTYETGRTIYVGSTE